MSSRSILAETWGPQDAEAGDAWGPCTTFEPTPSEFRRLAEGCIAFVESYRARALREPARRPPPTASSGVPRLDTRAVPLETALDDLRKAVDASWDTASPRYMGFIPGGGLPSAALADFVALAVNRYVGLRAMAPGLAGLEASVIRWLTELVGYPESALGVLTSGGSASILTAIITARDALLSSGSAPRGTLYVSEQGHGSVRKAARAAGFPADAVRTVAVDRRYRMDPRALEERIVTDRAEGKLPFLIVTSAGTTNTGAVDPIGAACDVASRHGTWVHADAAYGGFFLLTERGAKLLSDLRRCDSVTLDPHKGLFLPYGTGALVVQRGVDLTRAFATNAGYLRDLGSDEREPNFADLSFEMSRDFRGLRLWLPLRLHGLDAFREALNEKLDLAAYVYRELARDHRLEMLDEPQLSTVVFRPRRGNAGVLLDRINASGRVMLSSTNLDGAIALRMCILSFRTQRGHVEDAIRAVRENL